jgi:hydroxymethylglutaryl-CoA synthase
MLVSEDPSLVELSVEQGYGSADETDFLKPNQQFPSVDGKRSVQVYLARMREALEDFESIAGRIHPDDYRFIPFHTPFPGMVRKAAVLGYRHAIRDTSLEDDLAEEIGRQPREAEYDEYEEYTDAIREYMDRLQETEPYREWYERVIEPTLTISRHVGNWYTGSVHLARIGALRWAYDEGEQLLVGSYGSGAQAEIHAETVRPGWAEEIAALDLSDRLSSRYDLTYDEYEKVHDIHTHELDTEVEQYTTPDREFVFTGWGRMNERQYAFAG